MRTGTSDIVTLEEPGDAIWELLDQPRTVQNLVEALAEEYRAEKPHRIRADVEQFLAALVESGLARWNESVDR